MSESGAQQDPKRSRKEPARKRGKPSAVIRNTQTLNPKPRNPKVQSPLCKTSDTWYETLAHQGLSSEPEGYNPSFQRFGFGFSGV